MSVLGYRVSCDTYDRDDAYDGSKHMSSTSEYRSDDFTEAYLDFARRVGNLYGEVTMQDVTLSADTGIPLVMSAVVTNAWTVRIVLLTRTFTE